MAVTLRAIYYTALELMREMGVKKGHDRVFCRSFCRSRDNLDGEDI